MLPTNKTLPVPLQTARLTMEFHVRLNRSILDPGAIEAAFLDVDAAATVAIDPLDGWLRLSSLISASDVLEVLRGSGHAVEAWQVEQLPSVCCGSCSG
jgi:hypothetical protein